ncbi:hypothetical protein ACE6H2_015695 [Prunus campanulata]
MAMYAGSKSGILPCAPISLGPLKVFAWNLFLPWLKLYSCSVHVVLQAPCAALSSSQVLELLIFLILIVRAFHDNN